MDHMDKISYTYQDWQIEIRSKTGNFSIQHLGHNYAVDSLEEALDAPPVPGCNITYMCAECEAVMPIPTLLQMRAMYVLIKGTMR